MESKIWQLIDLSGKDKGRAKKVCHSFKSQCLGRWWRNPNQSQSLQKQKIVPALCWWEISCVWVVVVLVPPLEKSDRTLCLGRLGFLAPKKRKGTFVFFKSDLLSLSLSIKESEYKTRESTCSWVKTEGTVSSSLQASGNLGGIARSCGLSIKARNLEF